MMLFISVFWLDIRYTYVYRYKHILDFVTFILNVEVDHERFGVRNVFPEKVLYLSTSLDQILTSVQL